MATITDGSEPRFGEAIIGDRPGILIETSTQFGANTLEVTHALEHRLDALAPTLEQQGVHYHPALLRPASFIESAIAKLRNSLLIGAVLVVTLLLFALRDWRGALVSFSSIPLSLLATIWLLSSFGITLNTMSLGGLVVALGVVVDDAVIDVENITRRRRSATGLVDIRALFVERFARSASAGVLRHHCGRSGLPAHPDADGNSGIVLPAAVDIVPAGRRYLIAGGDERDAGPVRAGHESLHTAAGGFLSAPLQAGSSASSGTLHRDRAWCWRCCC